MTMQTKDLQLLQHILQYCIKIKNTISRFGEDFVVFIADSDYRDSVSMNLLQIGEIAGKLSEEYVSATKQNMDWRAMKAMRNFFAHNYGSMDYERIWQTAIDDIPKLKKYCEEQINSYC